MPYDNAGNLTNDTYSGQGQRNYDAENRMTAAQGGGNGSWQYYTYDANGQRVKRSVNVNGTQTETWQVYGVNGELLAEYAQNASASSPQKEYGYRSRQLLITAEASSGSGGNPFSFTDDPLVAGTTVVKATHLVELRTAVNQARAHAGLPAATWTDDPVQATVTSIRAVHITELRARLDQARATLGLSAASYTDPTLTAGTTTVKAAHLQELRTKTNEALTAGAGSGLALRWLVSDQLGTPRIIVDKSGTLSGVSRHDYLPFGEELFANAGGRTTGYTNSDGARQKFTGYERDWETDLDYAEARYYSYTQGRFTSIDPTMASARVTNPQSWNRYSYVLNKPLNHIDPSGLSARSSNGGCSAEFGNCDEEESGSQREKAYEDRLQHTYNARAATQAAQAGDADTFFAIMASDSTLTIDPQNGGPAGRAANAVPQSARAGPHNTVIVTYSDGTEDVRSGGSRSWRNNNPGNIRNGAQLQGEIGAAAHFAVFNDEAAGQAGIVELLGRAGYQALTVAGAIARWAPPNENDTASYQQWVQNVTGMNGQTQMNTLNVAQLQSMANAIRGIEGWTPGMVTFQRPQPHRPGRRGRH